MSSPERDIKPDLDLPKQASPSKKSKAPTKKSPSKAGSRSVKNEITGTADESGFKPTSKDMAYHYVMHALDKVTIETRKEIAQKLGVRQKNLDASWSINWKKRVDQVLHDAFCK